MGIRRPQPLPLFLSAYFVVVAVSTSPAALDAHSLVLYTALYLGLGHCIAGVAWLVAGLGRPGVLLGAGLTAAPVVWHLREQLGVPRSSWGTFVLAMLVALALTPLVSRRISARRAAATAAVATVALAFGVGTVFRLWETGRWRLLRHNKLIGTPAHYLLDDPVVAVRDALFDELRRELPRDSGTGESASSTGDGSTRHLVLVVVDTLRADALGPWGGDPGLMRETSRLASQSYRFTDVLANSSWTRPSVASLMTGRLPEEHGALDRSDALASGVDTLAELLQRRGYVTVGLVANFGAVSRAAGFDQGFQHFEELQGTPYARAAAVVDAVDATLRELPEREPCFLYVHFLDPHGPYLADHDASLEGITTPFPDGYEAELRYLDGELRRLVTLLEQHLVPAPWLIVVSDHGEEFGEHGEAGHGFSLYPEVLRVPAFLHRSGEPGSVVGERLELRDLFDLALRTSRDEHLDVPGWARSRRRVGRYSSIYLTTPRSWHRPYLATVAARRYEDERRALIWSAYGNTRELYDRALDPGERRNLAAGNRETVGELERRRRGALSAFATQIPVRHGEAAIEQLRALGYIE